MTRQVYGLLLDLMRRCRPQGRELLRGHHQDQAHYAVRGLVPDWFQVRHNYKGPTVVPDRCAILHKLQESLYI